MIKQASIQLNQIEMKNRNFRDILVTCDLGIYLTRITDTISRVSEEARNKLFEQAERFCERTNAPES